MFCHIYLQICAWLCFHIAARHLHMEGPVARYAGLNSSTTNVEENPDIFSNTKDPISRSANKMSRSEVLRTVMNVIFYPSNQHYSIFLTKWSYLNLPPSPPSRVQGMHLCANCCSCEPKTSVLLLRSSYIRLKEEG